MSTWMILRSSTPCSECGSGNGQSPRLLRFYQEPAWGRCPGNVIRQGNEECVNLGNHSTPTVGLHSSPQDGIACYTEMSSYEQGERTLAVPVMAHADATMLVTMDRNFYSYAFWQQGLATGARLLFRLSSVLNLPREEVLADRSYLSTVYASAQDRKKGRDGVRVRVIKYTLEGIPDAEPRYRLVTNWMDPTEAAAQTGGRAGR